MKLDAVLTLLATLCFIALLALQVMEYLYFTG